jgi:hypothetical protein
VVRVRSDLAGFVGEIAEVGDHRDPHEPASAAGFTVELGAPVPPSSTGSRATKAL